MLEHTSIELRNGDRRTSSWVLDGGGRFRTFPARSATNRWSELHKALSEAANHPQERPQTLRSNRTPLWALLSALEVFDAALPETFGVGICFTHLTSDVTILIPSPPCSKSSSPDSMFLTIELASRPCGLEIIGILMLFTVEQPLHSRSAPRSDAHLLGHLAQCSLTLLLILNKNDLYLHFRQIL